MKKLNIDCFLIQSTAVFLIIGTYFLVLDVKQSQLVPLVLGIVGIGGLIAIDTIFDSKRNINLNLTPKERRSKRLLTIISLILTTCISTFFWINYKEIPWFLVYICYISLNHNVRQKIDRRSIFLDGLGTLILMMSTISMLRNLT